MAQWDVIDMNSTLNRVRASLNFPEFHGVSGRAVRRDSPQCCYLPRNHYCYYKASRILRCGFI
ncbi:hypothetical protein CHS0354_040711 [Potamilus streckersoni]|uniref:Uncharacterized protein n=1 Tax=Potamilus streckersoni TaxID=2493646 RepID=A0AAE0VYK4_9BIVA|nr:hypothetical protein CHS0354_040711 [Potamilus streckersoni]